MDNLIFQEEGHIYKLGNRRLLSVSQVLSILDDRWKVDPFYLERGTYVHKATELYDRDDLDESTVDERIKPYLDAYIKFRRDTGFESFYIEHQLFHPIYFYAGTIDRIGRLNDHLIVLDLKSGNKVATDDLQGSAYLELCNANTFMGFDIKIKKVFDLYLKDDGNYSLMEIKKPHLLLPVFLAALKITQWKENL